MKNTKPYKGRFYYLRKHKGLRKAFLLKQTHCSEQKSELLNNTDLVWGCGVLALISSFIYYFPLLFSELITVSASMVERHSFCSFCMANNLLSTTHLVILPFTPHLLSRKWTMSWKVCWKGVSDPFNSTVDHKLLEKARTHSSSVEPLAVPHCTRQITLQKVHQLLLFKPRSYRYIFIPNVDTFTFLQTKILLNIIVSTF